MDSTSKAWKRHMPFRAWLGGCAEATSSIYAMQGMWCWCARVVTAGRAFACTWRPNRCLRAPLCRNNRRHPMQYQAGASPWDRLVAVCTPVAGQWTRGDSPALELWLGPWGPERWGDWVYRGDPNMSHVVYQNWRRHRPDGIDPK